MLTIAIIILASFFAFLVFLITFGWLLKSGTLQTMHPAWMIPLVITGGPIIWAVAISIILDIVLKKQPDTLIND